MQNVRLRKRQRYIQNIKNICSKGATKKEKLSFKRKISLKLQKSYSLMGNFDVSWFKC